MQLNLFQWDAIAVGNGYKNLSRLQFNEAGNYFSKVLTAVPDHPAAGQGLRDLQFWEDVFSDMAELDTVSQACFLWDRVVHFPFGSSEYYISLRLSLIRHLLQLIGDDADFYIPPDLCCGYLYLQLGDYHLSGSSLTHLLKQFPGNARLLYWLADAQYMQGKEESAGISYAVALLIAPGEVPVSEIRNRRLADVIREHDPELALVYGYFEGLLPLVDSETEALVNKNRIYELLRQAEQAMHQGNHDEMITARREFRHLSPNVFQDYLAWLQ